MTPEERQERLDEVQQMIADQVVKFTETLTSSEEWTRYLRVAAKFHQYSVNNQLLIMMQRPNAEYVAGYRRWQEMGRQVRRGERGIKILAPVTRKVAVGPDESTRLVTPESPLQPGEKLHHQIVNVKPATVFDYRQTDGEPIDEIENPPYQAQLLTGVASEGLWDSVSSCVTDQGYVVSLVSDASLIGGANGVTSYASREITIRFDMDEAQRVKTLIHELAHVLLHQGEDYSAHRGRWETEAESVAFLVAEAHGMDTSTYTIPYIAGWASAEQADMVSVIRSTAERVTRTAHTILTRTLDHSDPVQDSQVRELAAHHALLAARSVSTTSQAVAESATAQVSEPVSRTSPERIHVLHEWAMWFFTDRLEGPAEAYATERLGREPRGWVGYAPAGWDVLATETLARGVGNLDELVDAGLVKHPRGRDGQPDTSRVIDVFRDRIMFPIHNQERRIVGFSGRAMPGTESERIPKYMNTGHTAVYRKGDILYGGHRLTASSVPVLVEGPFDALAVSLLPETEAIGVASLGTGFTKEHAELLSRHGSLVLVGFDSDIAGIDAAEKANTLLLSHGLDVRQVPLSGKDPADMAITDPNTLRMYLTHPDALPILSVSVLQHHIDKVLASDLTNPRLGTADDRDPRDTSTPYMVDTVSQLRSDEKDFVAHAIAEYLHDRDRFWESDFTRAYTTRHSRMDKPYRSPCQHPISTISESASTPRAPASSHTTQQPHLGLRA